MPVIRNVETMNFADIERTVNALGEKVRRALPRRRASPVRDRLTSAGVSQARNNELAVEDMDGGTFTISNGGVFGSLFGTPIINPPQSAILGMHGIFQRPVAVNGKVREEAAVVLERCSGARRRHSKRGWFGRRRSGR